jgi:hypothetical protein
MAILDWTTETGSIGAVNEGSLFSFFFSFDMVPFGNVILVSGNLPDGLVFNPLDASIVGTVGFVDQTTTYFFTLRLQNENGIKDRSFSLTVNNLNATWITGEEIVQSDGNNYRTEMVVDVQLEIFNPSTTVPKFEIIAGNLPDNISLREDGRLVGFTSNNFGSYFFTAKVLNISKTFHITILNDNQNRKPFWSTIDGYIGNATSGTEFNFDFTGADGNNSILTFSLHPDDTLPNGLFLVGSTIVGNVSPDQIGNKFFRMIISDGISDVTRSFYIKTNIGIDDISFDIVISPFLSDDGNFTLIQDEPSYLKVTAFQQIQGWLRYEIISGSLPIGMNIDITNGNIVGSTIDTGTYNFVVRCYNDFGAESTQNFTMIINFRTEYSPNKVTTIIMGHDRVLLNDLYISNKIPYDSIYRAGDDNFGTTLTNELLIHKYVNATKNQIETLLDGRLGSEAIPIKFKHVPVQNSLGQVICECVILVFLDKSRTGLETFVSNNVTIQITSLDKFREKLSDILISPLASFVNWQSEYYFPNIQTDSFEVKNHDMYTGKLVNFVNQNIPSPFLNNNVYYTVVVDENTIRLAISKEDALRNEYIRFNVNEIARPGILHTPHTAIPFVYCKTGFGENVANSLNTLSLADIKLYFKHFVYGPTSTKNQEDLELIWFEDQRI